MISNLGRKLRLSSRDILPYFKTEEASNHYISSLCKQNLFEEALNAFDLLRETTSHHLKPSTYSSLILACSFLGSLEHGRKIHDHLVASNCQPDMILSNHMLNMFGKCGSLEDAQMVFDQMPQRNEVSWGSIIAGYSQNGQADDAIKLYFQMLQSDFVPDQFTFGSIIRACSTLNDLWLGRQLHAHALKSECGAQNIVQNALIAMYTKFGQIADAADVFSHIETKDLISWSSMIAGFSQLGYEWKAMSYFKEMLHQGICKPNEFIFGSAFNACGSLLQLEYGKQIHGVSIKFGLGRDTFAGCSVSDMYAKCGFLHSAETAFYQIERPDIVSWNAIIAAFANEADGNAAMSLFTKMRRLGQTPSNIIVRSLLCGFTDLSALYQGKQIHCYIIIMSFNLDVSVCNALLSMYAKCLGLFDAYKIFNEIQNKADLVSWNSILTACIQHNQSENVFSFFKKMLLSHNKPDHITLINALGACAKVACLEIGNQVCCYAMKTGYKHDTSVANGMIDMYVKCGSLGSANELFDSMENPDIISWSSLIVGYAWSGYGEEALKLFWKMRSLDIKPNEVTFIGVLTACSHVGLVEEGWHLYSTMEKEHGIVPTIEHCSCVVDLLARAGRINEAEAFVNQMPFDPDIVVWKILLSACKNHKNVEVGRRAAENVLKIDPSNSAAHLLLCNIYTSTGSWKDVSKVRSLMNQRRVTKTPGQSWIEIKDTIHVS